VSEPVATETIACPGLEAEAEILVDRWGVPHIRAGGRRDVFFVQGFNAARDRLWQLDIWRKRGLGRLAEDFGPGYLMQDRAARLFLYRGDMEAEWAAYGVADLKEIVTAFVAGLNAYIGIAEAHPERLPPEFAATGTRPARWAPEDVVRIRSHALVHNGLSEALRARVLAKADTETDLARRSIDPPREVVVPAGFDPGAFPDRAMDAFQLATAPVTFSAERLGASLEDAPRWSRVNALGEVDKAQHTDGSNNWAVAPARTGTGRALLASDPHRAYALPSLRYVVHLSAPGLDVIGTGEPALPGISFGHNGHAAFAMTIFPADQEDVYVYETDSADPRRYRYGDGFEAMSVVEETIRVKGAPDQAVTLAFTRHGPVVFEGGGRAVAIRTVWMEPGTAAYLASLAAMEARTPEDYRTALRGWGAPGANHVYADVDGRIGWFVACKVPKRPNFDGLVPVPGDGAFEWDGFHDPADLPQNVDPERGWVASANENNIPAGYPNEAMKLGFEFMEPSRAQRIAEIFAEGAPHGLAEAMALQTDDLSLPARRIVALLPARAGDGLFDGWDFRLAENSAAAALFEVWWTHHLKPALLLKAAGDDKALAALLAPGDHETLIAALETPGLFSWLPSADERDACLAATLAGAVAHCGRLMGEDKTGWAWGRLHHGAFPHPLSRVFPNAGLRDVGPLPKGGSGSTVMNTRYRPGDFRAVVGASFRTVIDVGAWDESVFINTPGQSGDPRSPHYDDLATIWAGRDYLPLLYSREAVDAAATLRIRLVPE
jgi:penicillin amidase